MKAYTTNPNHYDWTLRLVDNLTQIMMFVLLFLILLVCCSCGSTKAIQTIPIETIKEVNKTGAVYLNTFRFDSTYVSHDRIEKDSLIHSPSKGGRRRGSLSRIPILFSSTSYSVIPLSE